MNDYFEILKLMVSLIGVAFGLWQWKKTNGIKKAEFLKEAVFYLNSGEVSEVLLGLERKKDWYNKEFVKDNSLINKYGAVFAYLSYLCYLYLKKQISSSEFKMFEYIINRLARNKGFKDYMFNEYHFSKRNGVDIKSYYLLKYMKKRKMLDDSFWDNNSEKYMVLQNIRNN